MNASVSQVFTGHKAGGLEIKHELDAIRDLAHLRARMELLLANCVACGQVNSEAPPAAGIFRVGCRTPHGISRHVCDFYKHDLVMASLTSI
jgi:hypothetical protein